MNRSVSWVLRLVTTLTCLACLVRAAPLQSRDGLTVHLIVGAHLLDRLTDTGHVSLMFNPNQRNPLQNYDVTSTPNALYGKNAYQFPLVFSRGGPQNTDTGVWGFPNVTLNDLPPGEYSVQAFLNQYETVTRSDGSTVSVRFPCGDGAPPVAGYGTLKTTFQVVTITGIAQAIDLVFDKIVPDGDFTGNEIGGCNQGNYADTELLKHVKIRSTAVSEFWGRDMYVGANVLLPSGYDAGNTSKRYPVIYSQSHWPGGDIDGAGSFYYPSDAYFTNAWKSGVIPAKDNTTSGRKVPEFIIVVFRHETPFYDDSYAVNTANIGPYGDALNDELIPLIDQTFNTIPEPYARIQEGGSTGGWESAASLIFRPDLFGVTFSSYPDSLDFHRHQAIPLYTSRNAYLYDNGSVIPDIRTHTKSGTQVGLANTGQENHWELTFGTSSRSCLQWDVWDAVFGVQGYNNYPLEPWDKVTGEIHPGAVELWKPMDLSHYVTSNWDNEKNLGEVLKNRIFIYVGSWDTYYLNLPVMKFEESVNSPSKGGPGWANVTILADEPHGGVYQLRDIFNYLELLERWVKDHAPDGRTPLSPEVTKTSSRGNYWADVLAHGGRQAAVARQAPPALTLDSSKVTATVGRWDPGVILEARWVLDGTPAGMPFGVKQGQTLSYSLSGGASLLLDVTGTKRGYDPETRQSNTVSAQ